MLYIRIRQRRFGGNRFSAACHVLLQLVTDGLRWLIGSVGVIHGFALWCFSRLKSAIVEGFRWEQDVEDPEGSLMFDGLLKSDYPLALGFVLGGLYLLVRIVRKAWRD